MILEQSLSFFLGWAEKLETENKAKPSFQFEKV